MKLQSILDITLSTPTPLIHPPEDPYQSQNEKNPMTMHNLTNIDEDH